MVWFITTGIYNNIYYDVIHIIIIKKNNNDSIQYVVVVVFIIIMLTLTLHTHKDVDTPLLFYVSSLSRSTSRQKQQCNKINGATNRVYNSITTEANTTPYG